MVYLLKMVIFHCYVSSPEGNSHWICRALEKNPSPGGSLSLRAFSTFCSDTVRLVLVRHPEDQHHSHLDLVWWTAEGVGNQQPGTSNQALTSVLWKHARDEGLNFTSKSRVYVKIGAGFKRFWEKKHQGETNCCLDKPSGKVWIFGGTKKWDNGPTKWFGRASLTTVL